MAAAGPRVAVLDNLDSFTHSIVQMLAVLGAEVRVHRDGLPTPLLADLVVLSPGPGRPEDHAGLMAAVGELSTPIFGVCLGMQAIALACGGEVVPGRPVHGRSSAIHHGGAGIFLGLPSPFRATRYHSLRCVHLPPDLLVTARTRQGMAMAVEHRSRKLCGVQFHPESVRSEHGLGLIANVLAWARTPTRSPSAAHPDPHPSRSDRESR
jgi:anthranilate synthase/aminodeoxychorismate synthase-like glutamine amidotransferase